MWRGAFPATGTMKAWSLREGETLQTPVAGKALTEQVKNQRDLWHCAQAFRLCPGRGWKRGRSHWVALGGLMRFTLTSECSFWIHRKPHSQAPLPSGFYLGLDNESLCRQKGEMPRCVFPSLSASWEAESPPWLPPLPAVLGMVSGCWWHFLLHVPAVAGVGSFFVFFCFFSVTNSWVASLCLLFDVLGVLSSV